MRHTHTQTPHPSFAALTPAVPEMCVYAVVGQRVIIDGTRGPAVARALLYLMIQRGFKLSPINILAGHLFLYRISLSLSPVGSFSVSSRATANHRLLTHQLFGLPVVDVTFPRSRDLHPAASSRRDDLTIIYPITGLDFHSTLGTFGRTRHGTVKKVLQ